MFRFIGAAVAVAVGIWAVLRRQRPVRGGHGPLQTRTRMVIGGNPPAVTVLPEDLEGRRGTELVWVVENTTSATQNVSLRGFKERNNPGKPSPLNQVDGTVPPNGRTELRARVLGTAVSGTFKYSIWLNGVEAVDPIVLIYN